MLPGLGRCLRAWQSLGVGGCPPSWRSPWPGGCPPAWVSLGVGGCPPGWGSPGQWPSPSAGSQLSLCSAAIAEFMPVAWRRVAELRRHPGVIFEMCTRFPKALTPKPQRSPRPRESQGGLRVAKPPPAREGRKVSGKKNQPNPPSPCPLLPFFGFPPCQLPCWSCPEQPLPLRDTERTFKTQLSGGSKSNPQSTPATLMVSRCLERGS